MYSLEMKLLAWMRAGQCAALPSLSRGFIARLLQALAALCQPPHLLLHLVRHQVAICRHSHDTVLLGTADPR